MDKSLNKFNFRSLYMGPLPFLVLAHFANHLLTALPVPLLPMIRSEFGLDYSQSGLVISAFTLAYGIGQLPAGWLADHIKKSIVITISIIGVAFCGLVIGFSNGYILLLIFLGLMGLMGGGYHPAASPLVAESVEPKNRGLALGIHLIGGSASYFLAPLIAVAIAIGCGWRGSFVILSIFTIIFAVIFFIAIQPSSVDTKVEQKSINTNQTFSKPSHNHRLIVFIVLSSSIGAISNSAFSFIPLFMVDHFGVAKETGGAFIAILYSAGLWASLLGGYLSDRFGGTRILLISCFSLGFLIYLLNIVRFGFGIGALLLLMGIFMYMRAPASESYIIRNTSGKFRSTILGIYYFGSMEGSGVLTPLLGYSIDHISFQLTYIIVATSMLAVTLVCSIILRGSNK